MITGESIMAAFNHISDNEDINPLYYSSDDKIQKENKELKRSINTLIKMKQDKATPKILNKKDLAILDKSITAFSNLLHKREKLLHNNQIREAKKQRKRKVGAKWIKSNFKKIDIEFMLKVIYAEDKNTRFWNYYIDEIENKFNYHLEEWGEYMKTREEASEHVKQLYKALNDTQHPRYLEHRDLVKEALIEHEKTH